jgi:hypothetical protein
VIRSIAENKEKDTDQLKKELKHLGTSVMDVYSGSLSVQNICIEIANFLKSKKVLSRKDFTGWTGTGFDNYQIASLSDSSQWALKYHNHETRFVHLFPARMSPHSFRVKANTLKSAILYNIIIGKDYITGEDLNRSRLLLGLSPVKDPDEAEAVTEMIEIIRN